MAGTSAEQLLHEFRDSAVADATMSLLRSRNALLHLALMAAHLGDGQIVDGQSLTSAIDADLASLLRSYTPSPEDDSTPALVDADALLARWTKRGGGYAGGGVDEDPQLVRRLDGQVVPVDGRVAEFAGGVGSSVPFGLLGVDDLLQGG